MLIAGVDEAGRGPLAGPVVCAAVILPRKYNLPHLNDSKKISAIQREQLSSAIQASAISFRIAFVTAEQIDAINILQATMLGMRTAILELDVTPKSVLIDGNRIPENLPMTARAIVKGDATEPCIMAASILAKVARDAYMQKLHELFPNYGFAKHKGYPTAAHIQALQQFGISPEHRRSYAPVKNIINNS